MSYDLNRLRGRRVGLFLKWIEFIFPTDCNSQQQSSFSEAERAL
jgi:hypothetical protein